MAKQQGLALIMVLLVAIMLSSFAIYFANALKVSLKSAEYILDKSIAEQKIVDATFQLTFHSFKVRNDEVHSLSGWNVWGKQFVLENGVAVSLTDLGAKLSILPFNDEEWSHYLINKGVAKGLVAKIVDELNDWQDNDDFRRVQGAESKTYLRLGKAAPRNHIMQSVDELNNLKSMTPEIFALLKDELVYFGSSVRTPKYAAGELQSYFLKADVIDTLTKLKNASDNSALEKFKIFSGIQRGDVESVQEFTTNTYLIKLHAIVGESKAEREWLLFAEESDNWPYFYGSSK